MKLNDPHIQMLVNPRALKLNDVLEIVDLLLDLPAEIENIRDTEIDDLEFARKLVDNIRDITKLNQYIGLSEIDFAKKLLAECGYIGDDIDKIVESQIENDYENDEEEFYIEFTTVVAAIPSSNEFSPKIIDFSKSNNFNAYTEHPIAFDFIVKMQQKLWNGILDTYLNDYIDTCNTRINSIQRYDTDLVDSIMLFPNETKINIYFFKQNIINWAMAHGLIVNEDDVNVIDDTQNKQIIVNIEFTL